MAKESIETAVRMVGHLLEHNGVTGPFAANSKGESVEVSSPEACKFCMAGATDLVSTNTAWRTLISKLQYARVPAGLTLKNIVQVADLLGIDLNAK